MTMMSNLKALLSSAMPLRKFSAGGGAQAMTADGVPDFVHMLDAARAKPMTGGPDAPAMPALPVAVAIESSRPADGGEVEVAVQPEAQSRSNLPGARQAKILAADRPAAPDRHRPYPEHVDPPMTKAVATVRVEPDAVAPMPDSVRTVRPPVDAMLPSRHNPVVNAADDKPVSTDQVSVEIEDFFPGTAAKIDPDAPLAIKDGPVTEIVAPTSVLAQAAGPLVDVLPSPRQDRFAKVINVDAVAVTAIADPPVAGDVTKDAMKANFAAPVRDEGIPALEAFAPKPALAHVVKPSMDAMVSPLHDPVATAMDVDVVITNTVQVGVQIAGPVPVEGGPTKRSVVPESVSARSVRPPEESLSRSDPDTESGVNALDDRPLQDRDEGEGDPMPAVAAVMAAPLVVPTGVAPPSSDLPPRPVAATMSENLPGTKMPAMTSMGIRPDMASPSVTGLSASTHVMDGGDPPISTAQPLAVQCSIADAASVTLPVPAISSPISNAEKGPEVEGVKLLPPKRQPAVLDEPAVDMVASEKSAGVMAARPGAVSLLQLVRDHMAQTRLIARPANSEDQPVPGKDADMVKDNGFVTLAPMAPQPTGAAPLPATQSAPALVQPAAVDLSVSLGAQVIDMGVSGQWIDGLARDIAGLSAHGAQGRFQIEANQLGPIQVDIRQDGDGAIVSLTVVTEAAEMALRQDSDKLRLDAGLAAMRITDLKIERSPQGADAARSDPGQQSGGHPSGPPTSHNGASSGATHGTGQGAAQSQDQGQFQHPFHGRWQSRENPGSGHKAGGDPAVLNHADMGDGTVDGIGARYA